VIGSKFPLWMICIAVLSLVVGEGRTQDILSVPPTDVIAFTSDRDGQRDIYTIDAEGNHRRRLTNTPEQESDLVWSPDGKYLAYMSSHYDAESNEFIDTLMVMEADGSNIRALTSIGPSSDLRWMPDRQHLMFNIFNSADVSSSTAVISLAEPEVIKFIGGDNEADHVFSPDMSHIAYIGWNNRIGWSLHVMQADMTHRVRIMDGVRSAVWSPDSLQLAYIHSTRYQTYLSIINRDGSNLRRFPLRVSQFKWSPDGTQILLDGRFVINADGTNFHQLTAYKQGNIEAYDWSPDSKYVVFSFAYRADHPHAWPRTSRLYVARADGAYERLITHEEVVDLIPGMIGYFGSRDPAWQPHPRE
jgi:Tol biopolymer transport system component